VLAGAFLFLRPLALPLTFDDLKVSK